MFHITYCFIVFDNESNRTNNSIGSNLYNYLHIQTEIV